MQRSVCWDLTCQWRDPLECADNEFSRIGKGKTTSRQGFSSAIAEARLVTEAEWIGFFGAKQAVCFTGSSSFITLASSWR